MAHKPAIASFDGHDQAIGELSRAWSFLELCLASIMGELMETPPETVMVVSAALDHRHRQNIIQSLSAIKLQSNPAVASELSAFLGHVKGMNTERNAAIHSLWMKGDNGKIERINMRNQGVYMMEFHSVGAKHIKTIVKKTFNLSVKGMDLRLVIGETVRAWRQKFGTLDWPHLKDGVEHRHPTNPDTQPTQPEPSQA